MENLNGQMCPWSTMAPAHLNFCEAKLCAWIARPSETWSNLGFVFVGILILWQWSRDRKLGIKNLLWPMGTIGIVLGIFSGFYHASASFIGEWLDISSMLLFTSLSIMLNLARLYNLPSQKIWVGHFLLSLISMALIYIIEKLGVFMFGAQFLYGVYLEYKLHKQNCNTPLRANYVWFKRMAVIFLIGWAVWWLDITKVLCDPDNHIFTGHAFWHLTSAATFYSVYLFYAQFKDFRGLQK